MENRCISYKIIILFTIQPNVQTKWVIFPKKCKKIPSRQKKMMSRQAKKTNIITGEQRNTCKQAFADREGLLCNACEGLHFRKGCPSEAVPTPKLWVGVVAALPLGPRKTRRKIRRASLPVLLAPSRHSLLVSLAHQQRTNKGGCGNALQNTA